jgi:branched-chain amino acid transport system ATP-binding protein
MTPREAGKREGVQKGGAWGLAPVMKTVRLEGIKNIWKTGITVLVVEQDVSLTLPLTGRVPLLDPGNLEIEGKSSEWMDNEEVPRVYF